MAAEKRGEVVARQLRRDAIRLGEDGRGAAEAVDRRDLAQRVAGADRGDGDLAVLAGIVHDARDAALQEEHRGPGAEALDHGLAGGEAAQLAFLLDLAPLLGRERLEQPDAVERHAFGHGAGAAARSAAAGGSKVFVRIDASRSARRAEGRASSSPMPLRRHGALTDHCADKD